MSASRTRILVPVLLLLVVAAVVGGLLVGAGGDGDSAAEDTDLVVDPGETGATETDEEPIPVPPGPTDDTANEAPDLARRIEGDPMAAGPVDAPVGVVIYSDYSCPYCQSWARDTEPTLLNYADDGVVRVEWRDISILGEDSTRAAVAAAAAAQQDRYQEFHGLLFADLDARSAEELTAMAEEAGLDVEQFAADLADPAVQGVVQENMQEAQSLGLQSTPSFLVGGTPVVGAQPTEVFVEIIEQKLAATG